ncbi:hypothetical protein L6452_34409 [Arctium lappa]|uniref:Uncharacterized protein n=1 Tax=Arctium lappa TaxID=4217 RepID=A0ACB8YJ43_ARCLA|nr:hypothetical protein L6452_34409 [Arctium lappa]
MGAAAGTLNQNPKSPLASHRHTHKVAMAKRLIPCLNRVLVEKIVPPSKTTAGILLPEKSSKLNSGKVIAVGPGTRDKSGNTIPVSVNEGDTVLLPEYGGTEVKLGEKQYVFFISSLYSLYGS